MERLRARGKKPLAGDTPLPSIDGRGRDRRIPRVTRCRLGVLYPTCRRGAGQAGDPRLRVNGVERQLLPGAQVGYERVRVPPGERPRPVEAALSHSYGDTSMVAPPTGYSTPAVVDQSDPIPFNAVSSATSTLCVAVDADGNVLTSTNRPAGGPLGHRPIWTTRSAAVSATSRARASAALSAWLRISTAMCSGRPILRGVLRTGSTRM